jgi:hypothetical protein
MPALQGACRSGAQVTDGCTLAKGWLISVSDLLHLTIAFAVDAVKGDVKAVPGGCGVQGHDSALLVGLQQLFSSQASLYRSKPEADLHMRSCRSASQTQWPVFPEDDLQFCGSCSTCTCLSSMSLNIPRWEARRPRQEHDHEACPGRCQPQPDWH